MRRVVRPAVAPLARRHQRLEGPPEDLGVDGALAPLALLLAHREAVARKDVIEERPEVVVAKAQRAVPPLERRTREQPTIEEGDAPEGPGRRGPRRDPRVQGPEEERIEEATMRLAATGHRAIEVTREKVGVAVEPPPRLQEGEEDQTRGGEQGELAPHLRRSTPPRPLA